MYEYNLLKCDFRDNNLVLDDQLGTLPWGRLYFPDLTIL